MILQALHMVAAFVVLAEALNKLERADLFDGRKGALPRVHGFCFLLAPWRWTKPQAVKVFKVLGWVCLAIGSAGALASPFIHSDKPNSQDVLVLCGFAVLVVRSRLKEC